LITIDSNQNAVSTKELKTLLLQDIDRVPVEPLEVADVMFAGKINSDSPRFNITIGLEIKVGSDVLDLDRLLDELVRMTEIYDIRYLILVGPVLQINFDTGKILERRKKNKLEDGPIRYHRLNSILSRFEASGGHIRYVQDEEYLAALILSLYQFWRKDTHEEMVFPPDLTPKLNWEMIKNPMAKFYLAWGKAADARLGTRRAISLAKRYPTLGHLLAAGRSDMRNVPGMGKTRIDKIWRFISG